jgi:SAM-dependent methyltransferase
MGPAPMSVGIAIGRQPAAWTVKENGMTTALEASRAEDVEAPHALGTPPAVYRRVHEVLSRAGAKTILDCAAGQGAFSSQLHERSYDVRCLDVYPDDFKAEGLSCGYANLNDRIPFGDEEFDALTCLNALQRIWARGQALREMARVIKPGGQLVLSVFNNNNLMRRFMFLLTGSVIHDTCGPPYAYLPELPNPEASFRYAMTVGDMLAGIESVGLELESLDALTWSKGSLLVAPLALVPLLLQPFVPEKYKRHCHPRESSSPDILFKDCLVVVARKPVS